MTKYIVDLPDAYTSKSALLGDVLSIPIILEGGKRYGIPTGIKLESCTEPDEDEIRQKVENEVWELHKNIMYDTKYKGGLEPTYQEAKAKYEAWSKQNIRKGDEVIYNSRTKAIVLIPETKERYGTILTSEFDTIVVSHDELEKTGRHFEDVFELLKKMEED